MPRIKTEKTEDSVTTAKPVRRGRRPSVAKKSDSIQAETKKVPEKIVVRKEIKTSRKTESKENETPAPRRSLARAKASFIPITATFLLTAMLVGGAIYSWQSRSGQSDLSKIQKDARDARVSFEQRFQIIKDQLSGVESENQELKNRQELLAQQAELLRGAKKEFYSPELGLSFEYPAVFGNVNIDWRQTATGTVFAGSFSHADVLNFSGVSRDHESALPAEPANDDSAISFALADNQGFSLRRNEYSLNMPAVPGGSYDIEPTQVLNIGGASALLVESASFEAGGEDALIKSEAPLAAIINLDNDEYPAVTFYDLDLESLPQEDFITIIKSVIVE